MDHYVEQLVAKPKTGREYLLIGLIIAGVIAVAAVSFWFLGMFFMVITLAAGYGAYWLIPTFTKEYEYCVTNGDIDVDLITGKRARKRIVSVRGGKIESLEPFSGTVPAGFDRTVTAAPSTDGPGLWRFTYHSKKNGRTQVIFQPNEAVLDELIGGLSRPLQVQVRQLRGR
ncbi:MAG: hypothetical protein ACOYJY_00360 [Acutalibacteraceae bacterium]|jgi:hypothetical protein